MIADWEWKEERMKGRTKKDGKKRAWRMGCEHQQDFPLLRLSEYQTSSSRGSHVLSRLSRLTRL